ncbi:MAG: chemotaxis protein CheX [Spirochaetaceae bacterium]|jgi:chemotaxis protein CheX|nr:chemotaxis protein CheX [Spirochaetaceae bacterium]
MKAVHINPFLNSTMNLFENMLGTKPNVGRIGVVNNFNSHRWDVSGVIGINGAAEGVIAIRMTQKLVERLMKKSNMECDDPHELQEMSCSMVGEMANVIAGNALGEITQFNMNITVPIVIQGQNHSISWPHKTPVLSIPFTSSQGAFEVNVSLRENTVFGIDGKSLV